MAGHGRQRMGIGAFDEVQVRMAQAAGGSADQHFVRTGLADLQLFDLERLVRGDEDGGFHGILSKILPASGRWQPVGLTVGAIDLTLR